MDLGFLGLDFGVFDFGFWILDFGVWIFCFWSLDFGVWCFEFWILDLGLCFSLILDLVFWSLLLLLLERQPCRKVG